MVRPERLKSSLGNSSPLDPVSELASSTAAAAPALPAGDKPTKTKRTFYFYVETSERLLNAAEALMATPGAPRGPSDLAAEAVERYVDYLEATHNEGRPFAQRSGPLQRGPRVR
ncbi:hypothetical protein HQO84_01400 [Rhodococcus fascians]|nr:hypothetical protein [Rhodococcus fascians]MBY3995252.1 hypothetical protein [Rhodococcus fascians]MBY4000428.1 hypothetical protein [Rhodococcus fascians]MBY4005456.1 hypothetical protein [Rhodococcus fascians]MBY4016289.1 hypothetical protein [Rhodococcus fascians]